MTWSAQDSRRAPVGDFPPPWASAWGDDAYGLWAILTVNAGSPGMASQRMRWIEPTGPAGFWMGSPAEERERIELTELRRHADATETEPCVAVIADGFWLAETPCTQAFWMAVTGSSNPSHFNGHEDSPQRPVEQVSWDDVSRFIATLHTANPALDGRAMLPTEAQWEYAARAGSRTAYPWGDSPDDRRANWAQRHAGTTPVGKFPPNAFGLFDMQGNVWEWCADVWHTRWNDASRDGDKTGPPGRAVRGGSWIARPGSARSAYRGGGPPGPRAQNLGFRLALRSSSSGLAR